MEFKSLSAYLDSDNKRKHIFSSSGSPLKQNYSSYYDDDGVLNLIPDGESNLYDEIQSHAKSCDISLLVDRYLSGDGTALSRAQGFYGDITSMPKNFAEAMNLMNQAEEDFKNLPKDIKDSFSNDYRQFLAQVGSPEWFAKMKFPADEKESSSAASMKGDDKSE